MNAIGDALLHSGDKAFGPKIEALIVYNSNPVAVAPDSAKVAAGFAREDLFTIVLEHVQTDTADYADLVFPVTTQLEHLDVHKSYGHTHMMANLPAISPVGEARPNTEIFRGLARAMGLVEPALFETDEQIASMAFRWNDATLEGENWNTLKTSGWLKLKIAEAPLAEGGFRTPSGKCEFYSERLKREGLDPLPDYLPPYESADGSPELAARYPLAMISPPARNFLNSSFVNIESLRAAEREPHLDIHPVDAQARGIADGAPVRIFNDRGSMQVRARVTERARGRRRRLVDLVEEAVPRWLQHQSGDEPGAHRSGKIGDVLRLPGGSGADALMAPGSADSNASGIWRLTQLSEAEREARIQFQHDHSKII
ncbi:Anaerobic dehydrogenase, typically selenocysteine-containing [Candidatus Paraburkholderia kirkii]|nr:Anaerobic dehydrogenase, typically selenocysteine-containing [Candidatus Paraburkholderia kirkii]